MAARNGRPVRAPDKSEQIERQNSTVSAYPTMRYNNSRGAEVRLSSEEKFCVALSPGVYIPQPKLREYENDI
jgi:hypothetical protein